MGSVRISTAVVAIIAAVGMVSASPAGASTVPPSDDAPIDSAAALAGLEALIAANPSDGYPAVVIDICPFGDQLELAADIDAIVPIDDTVLVGDSYAWVSPDLDQPLAGCFALGDSDVEASIYQVEVHAVALRDLPYAAPNWGEEWERDDESSAPVRNGEMHTVCMIEDEFGGRVCWAQWVDEAVGLQIDLELWTHEGEVTGADAGAALDAVLPEVTTALAANA